MAPNERVMTHPPIDVVAGVIRRKELLLITQRMADDTLGGYWEFPGGKVDPGEELKAALHRELLEEIGVETEIGLRRFTALSMRIPIAMCGSRTVMCALLPVNRE